MPWPEPAELPADDALVAAMDLVREVASAGHSIRKASGLRARLPLRSLTVAGRADDGLVALSDLIASELNVKDVRFSDDVRGLADEVLAIVPSVLGPRLGKATQTVIAAARRGEWTQSSDGTVEVGGAPLLAGEYSLQLRPVDEKAARVLAGGKGIAVLDLETDEALEAEGVARDVVRLVQQARRGAGLNVSDRIRLRLGVTPSTAEILQPWLGYVSSQTLAESIELDTVSGRTGASAGGARGADMTGDAEELERAVSETALDGSDGTITIELEPVTAA
jgi:isoleucyl-tRNA synthetase